VNQKKNKSESVVDESPRETTVEFLSSLAATAVKIAFVLTFIVHAFEIPSS